MRVIYSKHDSKWVRSTQKKKKKKLFYCFRISSFKLINYFIYKHSSWSVCYCCYCCYCCCCSFPYFEYAPEPEPSAHINLIFSKLHCSFSKPFICAIMQKNFYGLFNFVATRGWREDSVGVSSSTDRQFTQNRFICNFK